MNLTYLSNRISRLSARLYHSTMQRRRYAALADPGKILFLGIRDIAYIVDDRAWAKWYPPGTVVAAFADLEAFSVFSERDKKFSSVRAHFVDGVPWAETEMFRLQYAPRLEQGPVRGCRTMAELEAYYERYDPLFRELERDGLDHRRFGRDISPLYVHISRHGDFIWTANGLHRLGMCMVLGIDSIPCMVHARHREWQERRERLRTDLEAGRPVDRELLSHPDMQDIVRPRGEPEAAYERSELSAVPVTAANPLGSGGAGGAGGGK